MKNTEIVNCGGLDCNLCNLIETISNIFNWLLLIAFPRTSSDTYGKIWIIGDE